MNFNLIDCDHPNTTPGDGTHTCGDCGITFSRQTVPAIRPEPTVGCRRYGCHENPTSGNCNRCGRVMR